MEDNYIERSMELTLRITEDCYEVDFYDCNSGDCVTYSIPKTEPFDKRMAKMVSQEIQSWFDIMEEEQEEE